MNKKHVLIHGLGQTPDSWKAVLSRLELTGYTICPDLTKLIISAKNRATYDSVYTSLTAKLDACEEGVNLCGLSLGGVLALNYAVDRPEKVNSLVLIAAQYKMPKYLLQFQNIIFRLMPNTTFQSIGLEKEDFINLTASMTELDFSDSLHAIRCPTLIICGSRDNANKKASIALAAAIRGSELHIVSGAGHEVNAQAPDKLADILNAFYRQIAPDKS